MIDGVLIKKFDKYKDSRGWLTEIFRRDESDHAPAMAYVSVTLPGVVRGPHEHRYQSDYFAFTGPGRFKVYLWDARDWSPTKGEKMVMEVGEDDPCSIIVPPGVIHAYKCTSDHPSWCVNMPDKLYRGINKKEDHIDEVRWEEILHSPYIID